MKKKKIHKNAPDKNRKTPTLNISFTIAYTNIHTFILLIVVICDNCKGDASVREQSY
jgi:hypothetical protein